MLGRWLTVNLSSPKQDQNLILATHTSQKLPTGLSWQYLFFQPFPQLSKQYFRRKHTTDCPFHSPKSLGDVKWRTSVKIQGQKCKIICLGVSDRNPQATEVSFHVWLSLPAAQHLLPACPPACMHGWFIKKMHWWLIKPISFSIYLKDAPCHRCTSLSMQMMSL